jgi:hypothetical protein
MVTLVYRSAPGNFSKARGPVLIAPRRGVSIAHAYGRTPRRAARCNGNAEGTERKVLSARNRPGGPGGIGRIAIGEYIRCAAVIGLTWQPSAIEAAAGMGHIHAEFRRRAVTLWEEYRGHHPDGHSRSRFCDLCVVEWRHGITATIRKAHAAGEKLFMAFAEGHPTAKNLVFSSANAASW